MKNCGLIRFLKGDLSHKIVGCANYDHYYGGCLFRDNSCKVENGKQCNYFEKAVLPTAAELGISEKINALYAKQVGLKEPLDHIKKSKKTRSCVCGEVLKPRHRYCEKCSKKRQRKTNREYAQKMRLLNRL